MTPQELSKDMPKTWTSTKIKQRDACYIRHMEVEVPYPTSISCSLIWETVILYDSSRFGLQS